MTMTSDIARPQIAPAPAFQIETITPEKAAHYLEYNTRNRPKSSGTVYSYARAIKNGHWMMNAEAIKFDWNGSLVDGQHRLAAIVLAEKAVDILVARNLDPNVFATIDTGKKRGASDILAMHEVRYSAQVSSAYRALWRYSNRNRAKDKVTNTELLALYEKHPNLAPMAYECMQEPLATAIAPPAQRMFLYWMASTLDRAKAHAFLAELASDDESPSDTAARMLRDRLTSTMQEVIPPSPAVKSAWLLIAWNHYLAGSTPDRLPRIFSKAPAWDPRPRLARLGDINHD